MQRQLWMFLVPLCLAGCDQLSERAGFPDAAKVEADGKAIGGACRHAGRGLEDCYRLNKGASKAAVFAGWKEMNEYMMKNNMETVEPGIGAPGADAGKQKPAEGAAHGDKPADKKAEPDKKAESDKKGDVKAAGH